MSPVVVVVLILPMHVVVMFCFLDVNTNVRTYLVVLPDVLVLVPVG